MARAPGSNKWITNAKAVVNADVGSVVEWLTDPARIEEWRDRIQRSAVEPVHWHASEENGERIEEADYLCRNGRRKAYRGVTAPIAESRDPDGSERRVLTGTRSVVQTGPRGQKGSTGVNVRTVLVGRDQHTEIYFEQTTVCVGSPWSWRLALSVIGPVAQRRSSKDWLRRCKAYLEDPARR